MRVAEEHPFISYFIKLTFINGSDGKNMVLDVDSSMEVDRMKMQVVSHFQGSDDSLKKSLYFTLVSVKTSKVLPEKTKICDIGLSNGDEIILLAKRLDVPEIKDQFMKKKEETGPDLKTIASATKHLQALHIERPKPAERTQPDFSRHTDVLVTLIDLAHKLLCMNSETSKLFEETEKCLLEEKEKSKEEPPKYDLSALKQLEDMGFPKDRAILALLQNNNSLSESLQWLLEHEGETLEKLQESMNPAQSKPKAVSKSEPPATDDTAGIKNKAGGGDNASVGGANTTENNAVGGANASVGRANASVGGANASVGGANTTEINAIGGANASGGGASASTSRTLTESLLKSVRSMEKQSTPDKVRSMLDSFRAFGRKGFKPDSEAMQSLKEMGFEEVDILEALRVNGNRRDLACEWLLGGRELDQAETQITGCIEEDSELFKALVDDPQVQVGLNSTKCLIALLTILENPGRMQQWLKEPEVGPLLQNAWRIFTTYMEKQGRQVQQGGAIGGRS